MLRSISFGNRIRCFWVVLLMMGVAGLNAKASGPLPGLKVPHKHIGQRDGLPTARINRLIQDSQGFIWIATSSGLNRFDGGQFVSFLNANAINRGAEAAGVIGKPRRPKIECRPE